MDELMDEANETTEAPVEEKPKKRAAKSRRKPKSKPVADSPASLVEQHDKATAWDIPTPDQVGGSSWGAS